MVARPATVANRRVLHNGLLFADARLSGELVAALAITSSPSSLRSEVSVGESNAEVEEERPDVRLGIF